MSAAETNAHWWILPMAYVLGSIPFGFLIAKARGLGDRKSTRLNSSHIQKSRMPSSA